MRYDLATNFDNELIERVASFGVVKSVYGKLASDVVGGGRPSIVLPNIGRGKLREHIQVAHDNNIRFNYLLNASCTGNQELVGPSHREFMGLVEQVVEDGADGVTVATPTMLGIVREQFPDLEISASIFLNIDSLNKIKHFESMGADELTLYYNFNRNFGLLKKALDVANEKTSLRLIANNVCLHNCPYRFNHANLLSHSSQSKDKSKGFVVDAYTVMCGLQKISNPAEFLMSDWIRPEDVHFYEELADRFGKTNLTLKLTDRARTTDWLVDVVEAYANQSYDGNLMDILNYNGNKGGYSKVRMGAMIRGAIAGRAEFMELLKLKKATFLPEVFIDNKSLDGFLQYFIENPCGDKTCYTSDKSYGECKHCYTLAEKVVNMDSDKRDLAIKGTGDLVKSINSGRMFKR